MGTRRQEPYKYVKTKSFADVIGVRYKLLPYIYSEYMKAALDNKCMFRPMAFEYFENVDIISFGSNPIEYEYYMDDGETKEYSKNNIRLL